MADKLSADTTLAESTSQTLVEETLASLRKLAETLDDEKWLYEENHSARRVECSL